MKQYILLIAFGLLSLFHASAQKKPGALKSLTVKPSGKFLILSDIHFNPFCYPGLVSQLVQTDYTGWQAIFNSSVDTSYGAYKQDTYYRLFLSGLKAMQAANPSPDMIVINGDFICHDFGSIYQSQTHNYNRDSLRSFIKKTTSFVFMMITHYFPNTPVLPVLGNNDDYCGDYNIQPNGSFLSYFAAEALPMLNGMKQTDFVSTFSKGGYYKVAMPWDTTNVFIGLNTVFFSPSFLTAYHNPCSITNPVGPGAQELTWLRNTLADCAAKGKKVWLSYHIPPGIDIYNSKSCNVSGMWKQAYNDTFITLVNQYSSIIKGNFAGHTHMDEFRLISNGASLTSFIHITPAISPIFQNNPGFVEITWNPWQMQLINSITYRFGGLAPTAYYGWTQEYDYAKTFGLKSIDQNSLGMLWAGMNVDATTRAKYLQYYYVSNPAKIPAPWQAYLCGARYTDVAGFTKCNCGLGVQE